jgi:hypothetical protein
MASPVVQPSGSVSKSGTVTVAVEKVMLVPALEAPAQFSLVIYLFADIDDASWETADTAEEPP